MDISEKIRELMTYEKHQQLHEYLTNLDENLVASSFELAEQLYLDLES